MPSWNFGWSGLRGGSSAVNAPARPNEAGKPTDGLHALIGAIDIPAFVLDGAGRVLVYSIRCKDVFPEMVEGRTIYQVSRQPELLGAVQEASHRRTSQSADMFQPAPRGRRMRITVTPLPQEPGATGNREPSLFVQLRDMSEIDRLAQLRSEFIANASHELRTPLASIKGFIETLQGSASGDAAARTRFLSIMEEQAARMTRILDDLLSLSRIEMHAHLLPTKDVDVVSVVEAVVQGLEPLARSAKIKLQFSPPSDAYIVRGDYDELSQVFQNLIQNAIKYGDAGNTVDVTVAIEKSGQAGTPNKVVASVADDGPGISAEHLPRLTERFYRVDTATSRERGGTGLGLAIVKHILNRHRGELKVSSTPGEGSTFTVTMDAVRQERR